jgi:hypothetical protein
MRKACSTTSALLNTAWSRSISASFAFSSAIISLSAGLDKSVAHRLVAGSLISFPSAFPVLLPLLPSFFYDKETLQTHNDHDNHKPKTETQRAPHLGHNRQVRHYIMTMTTMYDVCETRLFIEIETENAESFELTEMDRR